MADIPQSELERDLKADLGAGRSVESGMARFRPRIPDVKEGGSRQPGLSREEIEEAAAQLEEIPGVPSEVLARAKEGAKEPGQKSAAKALESYLRILSENVRRDEERLDINSPEGAHKLTGELMDLPRD